ncbi:MAG TPA: organomercurial lyase [Candidatus Limnocylindrales bacterium]|nr:organomercurial lyase [Candidatus Limnocylindrales bacterium]
MPTGLDEAVRLAVYQGFANDAHPPTIDGLATTLDTDASSIHESLSRLSEARHVVLDADGRIVMAHPFASIPLDFSVMGRRTLWWGGCAWDSFAIPQLVPSDPEVLVATHCPGCGRPLAWVVDRESPPPGNEVAHFLVPMARAWDDVVHTCSNQRLFCTLECVERWAAHAGVQPGYVMDLATLWRLASHWYDGRLEPGYQRREPARARDYFKQVGLKGPFWGLD